MSVIMWKSRATIAPSTQAQAFDNLLAGLLPQQPGHSIALQPGKDDARAI
jgi:hypothetical protein